MSFEGKIALVTGAARGIGRAIAETFAHHGAQVVLADLNFDQVNETALEISQESGQKTLALPVDVSDTISAKEMVTKALEEFGHVDILVNNAG
ncbi:MAG: SDR family NAD(P)-dependent oxidoreductase, partial [Anaerolineales bacterium]|nr:SDR family NAD(P)-dependent oxidoreductase [Anaerolineales bacterium]